MVTFRHDFIDNVTMRGLTLNTNGNAPKVETLEGVEFVRRYLRHVLPRGRAGGQSSHGNVSSGRGSVLSQETGANS